MTQARLTQRIPWLLVVISGIVVLDQTIKIMMQAWLGPGNAVHRHELLGIFVAFEYLENTGAAFGLFADGTLLLAIISMVIVGVGFFVMVRIARTDFPLALAIALIIGGAIGNAIDRVARGYVIDFIAIGRFWKFNLADSAVTIGVLTTFALMLRAEYSTQASIGENQKP